METFRLYIYFPPNTTALLQPLDQNIIKSIKTSYQRKLLLSLLSQNKESLYETLQYVTLKEVVYMVVEAWNKVNMETIISGFKHLFCSVDDIIFNLSPNHFQKKTKPY